MTRAQRIRTRRKELGLTQLAAAALCGVDPSVISRAERGKPIGPGTVVRIYRAFGIDPSAVSDWDEVAPERGAA